MKAPTYEDCPKCLGSGFITQGFGYTKRCNSCGGSGKLGLTSREKRLAEALNGLLFHEDDRLKAVDAGIAALREAGYTDDK